MTAFARSDLAKRIFSITPVNFEHFYRGEKIMTTKKLLTFDCINVQSQ